MKFSLDIFYGGVYAGREEEGSVQKVFFFWGGGGARLIYILNSKINFDLIFLIN